ncbi:MAG TPA: DNA-binding response regulator [Bacteroidetes bacterium]|nr:response regulator transcription factor [Ignavibacteria bacterium]HCA43076.1 DNA-binding response regulator [Bacteroidota bacterium]HCN38467.1 DNA-binding response regulator [Bacteroidota bacterium]
MIKILLVDDHQMIREGVKKILKSEPDIKILGEAKNGVEAIDFVSKNEIDLVVLDITLPGQSGIDIMKSLLKIKSKIKILIFSMHPEDRFAVRALKSGAHGYLTKDSGAEQLVNAIRKIINGNKYISETLAEQLALEIYEEKFKELHEYLSDREFEVFLMISRGKKVSNIADQLNISIPTVNTYRARILEKMKMKTNVELSNYAVKHNLIES